MPELPEFSKGTFEPFSEPSVALQVRTGQASPGETLHVSRAILRMVPYFDKALSQTWQDHTLELPDGCDVSVFISLLTRISSKEPGWGKLGISTVMQLIQLSSMLLLDDVLEKELEGLLRASVYTQEDFEEIKKWTIAVESPDFLKRFLEEVASGLALAMTPAQIQEGLAQTIGTPSQASLKLFRKVIQRRSRSGGQGLQETGDLVIEALGQTMSGEMRFLDLGCNVCMDDIRTSGKSRNGSNKKDGSWITVFRSGAGAATFVSDIAFPFLMKHPEFLVPAFRAFQSAFPLIVDTDEAVLIDGLYWWPAKKDGPPGLANEDVALGLKVEGFSMLETISKLFVSYVEHVMRGSLPIGELAGVVSNSAMLRHCRDIEGKLQRARACFCTLSAGIAQADPRVQKVIFEALQAETLVDHAEELLQIVHDSLKEWLMARLAPLIARLAPSVQNQLLEHVAGDSDDEF